MRYYWYSLFMLLSLFDFRVIKTGSVFFTTPKKRGSPTSGDHRGSHEAGTAGSIHRAFAGKGHQGALRWESFAVWYLYGIPFMVMVFNGINNVSLPEMGRYYEDLLTINGLILVFNL